MMRQPVGSPGPPAPGPKRWIALAAGIFVLAQMLIPLRYYLNTPTPDERFAWRMFSSVKMRDCEAILFEVVRRGDRTVERRIPPAMAILWQKSMDDNKGDVVRKWMHWWSRRPDVVQVRYEQRCRTPDGRKLEPVILTLDADRGQIRLPEPANP